MAATQILVIGRQGSGKSSAWENVDAKETVVITPNSKPLPWANSAKFYIQGGNRIQTDKLVDVPGILKHVNDNLLEVKNVLIEDLTHFMSARTLSPEFMARNFGGAYQRWSDFAADVAAVIKAGDSASFRDDLNIVYNGHTEVDDSGKVVLQTSGKLLDRDFKIQSYFTYVLHSLVRKDNEKIVYKFLTNEDGVHEAKTPKGCFNELLIDNDMEMILKTIRKYQGN